MREWTLRVYIFRAFTLRAYTLLAYILLAYTLRAHTHCIPARPSPLLACLCCRASADTASPAS